LGWPHPHGPDGDDDVGEPTGRIVERLVQILIADKATRLVVLVIKALEVDAERISVPPAWTRFAHRDPVLEKMPGVTR
jgi:hypothetical protein